MAKLVPARLRQWWSEPENLRRVHLWAAIAWMFPGIPLAAYIAYVMPEPHAAFAILVVSLWANTATHLGVYGAARAEQQAKEASQ